MLHSTLTPQAIDDVLAGTFPASDPPAWTPGIARPAPQHNTSAATNEGRPTDAMNSSRTPSSGPTLVDAVASIAAVGVLALLVPFVILAVGTPVALAVRGLVGLGEWILSFIR
jgi:hypothetical protein